jgi:hypothetical protein
MRKSLQQLQSGVLGHDPTKTATLSAYPIASYAMRLRRSHKKTHKSVKANNTTNLQWLGTSESLA